LNALKTTSSIKSLTSAFISLTETAVRDAAGNQIVAIPTAVALGVKTFTADVTKPYLIGYSLSMDQAIMALEFSEPVLAASLVVTALTLQAQKDASGMATEDALALTGGTVSTQNAVLIVVQLDAVDVNTLKTVPTLAVSPSTTYLVFSENLVTDMNYNNVTGVSEAEALQVGTFEADATSPRLVEFDIDLDGGVVYLYFSEVIKGSSFSVSQITLQDGPIAVSSVTLTVASQAAVHPSDFTNVIVTIGRDDLNSLKSNRVVGKAATSTYITITDQLVTDTTNNKVEPIANGDAKRVRTYVGDSTPPVLEGFEIDMTRGVFCLTFSEKIDVDSLAREMLALASEKDNSSYSIPLIEAPST